MRYFSIKGIISKRKNGKCETKDAFQRKANDDQSIVSSTSIETKDDWNRNSMSLPFELSNIHKNDTRHDSNISTLTLPDNNSCGSNIQMHCSWPPPIHDLGRRPYIGGFSAAAYEAARFDYVMRMRENFGEERVMNLIKKDIHSG